jgi:hypothetical protein
MSQGTICDELATAVCRLRDVIHGAETYNQRAFLESCDELYCMLLETMDKGWEEIVKLAQELPP